MKIKLSEIFISLPDQDTYSAEELYALKLHPAFIEKMADYFKLTYMEENGRGGNLCFAENREVRPEYRTTFGKADVVKYVFLKLSGEMVNLKQDEVVFQKNFLF